MGQDASAVGRAEDREPGGKGAEGANRHSARDPEADCGPWKHRGGSRLLFSSLGLLRGWYSLGAGSQPGHLYPRLRPARRQRSLGAV